jgi:hypothetical protein
MENLYLGPYSGDMSDANLPQTAPKSSFKFVMTLVASGIFVAVTLVSIYMPRTILWYFDPPTPMGVSCSPSIHWALDRLLYGQLVSIGVGAVMGLALGLKFRKKS